MFEKFDRALAHALSGEHTMFGTGDRRLALWAARRAAADNRVKALNEASIGNASFAAILEHASTRFHEDAEAMARGKPPLNTSVAAYLSTAETYRNLDDLRTQQPSPRASRGAEVAA